MKTFAHIDNGKVVNVFDWNDAQNPSGNFVDVTNLLEKPLMGWSYDGSNFIATPKPVFVFQEIKEQKMRWLKQFIAPQVIYLKAPVFKQANVGMGIYDAATSAPIVKWVKAVRQAVQEIEDKINLASMLVEIEAIVFDFESVKARVEEIFVTFI